MRKVLKPTLLSGHSNTTRSEDSWLHVDAGMPDESGGPFDFRKLLRKTNNAPTDTLKRLRGTSTGLSAASCASSSTSV